MNLFSVLIDPQSEERELGERALVCSAANVLQIGEFQFLQLAHSRWFGRDLNEAALNRLFASYMLRNEVPLWARHLAREVLDRDAAGRLDPDHPAWHRYDHTFVPAISPERTRAFIATAGILAVALLGLIVTATTAVTTSATSIFPPVIERGHLPQETDDASPSAERRR